MTLPGVGRAGIGNADSAKTIYFGPTRPPGIIRFFANAG